MTPQQIQLVKNSWQQVKPIADTAATIFYQRLFELDPKLKPLFKNDLQEQGRKLMNTISFAVNSLDKLTEIIPAVEALGRRHAGYGVKDADYQSVAEALLWTLQKGLGTSFTPETRQAWIETYNLLSQTMRKAANPVSA
ncbi:MAG: hemin receptor [Gammaproteobacteria bacterium]|nr:hemin receptor [Gammaproteobacteria bacterium]